MASRSEALGIATALATFGSQFAPPGTGIGAANAQAIDQIQASLQAEIIREQRKKRQKGGRLSKGLAIAGGIAGSFIPIPGVGTAVGAAIGSGIGSAVGKGIGTAVEGGDVGQAILGETLNAGIGVGTAAAGQKLTALRGEEVSINAPVIDGPLGPQGKNQAQPAGGTPTLQSVATRTSDEINRLAGENRAATGQTPQTTAAQVGQQAQVGQPDVEAPLTTKEKLLGGIVQSIPDLVELLRDPESDLPDIRQFGLSSAQLKEVNDVLKSDREALQAGREAEKNRALQLELGEMQNEARIKAAEIQAAPGLARAQQAPATRFTPLQSGNRVSAFNPQTGRIERTTTLGDPGVTTLQRAKLINETFSIFVRAQEAGAADAGVLALAAALGPEEGGKILELINAGSDPKNFEKLQGEFDRLVEEGAFASLNEALTAPAAGSAATLQTQEQTFTDTAGTPQAAPQAAPPATPKTSFESRAEFEEAAAQGLIPGGSIITVGENRFRAVDTPQGIAFRALN